LISWGLNTFWFKNLEREKDREGEDRGIFYFSKSDVKRLSAVFRRQEKENAQIETLSE
jgi:hypothetical protein